MIHYLRYDDGYTVCLRKRDLEYDEFGVWELKQAKLQYLETIANDASHWIAESPLAYEATCRILTLTHEDFAGIESFMNVMKQNDKDAILKFTLDKQNDASEFRTIVCLSRLGDLMVDQTPTYEYQALRQTWAQVGVQAKQNTEAAPSKTIAFGWNAKKDKDTDFHYYENGPFSSWIRPTSRPGEKGTMPLGKKEKKASLVVRKNPCPVSDSMELIVSEHDKEEEARRKAEKRGEAAVRKAREAALKRIKEEHKKKRLEVQVTHDGDEATKVVAKENSFEKEVVKPAAKLQEPSKPSAAKVQVTSQVVVEEKAAEEEVKPAIKVEDSSKPAKSRTKNKNFSRKTLFGKKNKEHAGQQK